MPLSETARKYALAIYEKKADKLSSSYEEKLRLGRKHVDDKAFWQTTIGQRFLQMKAEMLAAQVRAKGFALEVAYSKDGKVLDDEALGEIMVELEDHAGLVSQEFTISQQQEHDSIARTTGNVDLDLTARLNELKRSTAELVNGTLDDIRSSLQTQVYENQLKSQPNRFANPAGSPSLNVWHAEIEAVSRQLFQDGHYREAVLNSYIRVIEAVKHKSAIDDDGDGLMGKAFGCELSRLPKVQFNPCQTQAEIDEQKGIMFLFKGVVAIRNSKAHTIRLLDDEHRAREYVGLSSLLMRLLDIAKVNQ
jgi:uncharacterized protein (TIGR02391 family)